MVWGEADVGSPVQMGLGDGKARLPLWKGFDDELTLPTPPH